MARLPLLSVAATCAVVTLVPTVSAQRPAATAGPPVTLTPQQRAKLATLGWPPRLPIIRPRDDLVFRRDGQPPVSGSLTTLHGFATVTTQNGEVRVPRDAIGFIFVNRRLIPAGAPALPLDTDAVLLANGQGVVTGRVEVDGEVVHVAARTVPQADVAVIHLHDPDMAQQQQAVEAGGAATAGQTVGPPTTGGAGGAQPAGAGPAGAAPRPKGPSEIPWGQALWRGTLRFETSRSSVELPSGRATLEETEHGSYYVTWSEETVGRAPYISMIRLHPVSLVYQDVWSVERFHDCSAFNVNKQGSGFDGVYPDLPSGGTLYLALPNAGAANAMNAGAYLLSVFSPIRIPAAEVPKNCAAGGQPYSSRSEHDLPGFSFGRGALENGCTSTDTAFRALPPYTTISGDRTCTTRGTSATLHWRFDRGIPPPNVGISQTPCETPRGLLSLSQDQRRQAVDRLRQIGVEFAQARQDEARFRNARDQLQGAFDLLLVASAGSDLGQKLLAIALGDGMLKTAAEAGEITAAQQQFIGNLNNFIRSYETWTKFADNPGGWGQSKLVGGAQQSAIGAENQAIIDAALELTNYGRVLADAIGQGDGTAAQHYIEENLGAFGPLVPEYALSKARQYVEVTKQWSGAMKTMARLAAEGTRLAGQIAELDLGIKVRERQLQDCLNQ